MDNRDDAIEERRMDDPSASFAEWIEQVRTGRSNPGTSPVRVNMHQRIGGLAYIRKRELHHERTAERFLSLYETRYGAISPAVDPAREPVNTSATAHDNGMASRLDASQAIREAETFLGDADFRRLVVVIALGAPCSESPYISGKASGRALQGEVAALLGALDRLAVHWNLMTRTAA